MPAIDSIFIHYQNAFASKVFVEDEDAKSDLLMDVFGITPEQKQEHRQYWGRELGMCWQRLVVEACKNSSAFDEPVRERRDELCDLVLGRDAVDTKYRLGSGDAGTLKKFRNYALRLREMGLRPVLLILREDSLESSLAYCRAAGWTIFTGTEVFDYLRQTVQVELAKELKRRRSCFQAFR